MIDFKEIFAPGNLLKIMPLGKGASASKRYAIVVSCDDETCVNVTSDGVCCDDVSVLRMLVNYFGVQVVGKMQP